MPDAQRTPVTVTDTTPTVDPDGGTVVISRGFAATWTTGEGEGEVAP